MHFCLLHKVLFKKCHCYNLKSIIQKEDRFQFSSFDYKNTKK